MDGKVRGMVEEAEGYAKRSGYKLNPDSSIVNAIMLGLLANERKHGARYCPCRMVTGDSDEDRKIVCPCVYHRDEIKKMGHCHCGLYVKK